MSIWYWVIATILVALGAALGWLPTGERADGTGRWRIEARHLLLLRIVIWTLVIIGFVALQTLHESTANLAWVIVPFVVVSIAQFVIATRRRKAAGSGPATSSDADGKGPPQGA